MEQQKEYCNQKQQPKKYKKVVYEEELDGEPELEEDGYAAEEIEDDSEIKKSKKSQSKRKNNTFDYINIDAKRYKQ